MESDFPEINEINQKVEDLGLQVSNARSELSDLTDQKEMLEQELADLKNWIWRSDNPNIVHLRRELLAAARLIRNEGNDVEEDEEQVSPPARSSSSSSSSSKSSVALAIHEIMRNQNIGRWNDMLWTTTTSQTKKS